jgi:gliding motility-associated-like protein
MKSLLQYYKKNTNPRFCLCVILLFILMYNGYSQTARFRFEKRNNCAPARVIFTNESSQGPGITYEWDFGNGAVSNSSEMVLEEAYQTPGSYNIVLRVIEGTDTVMAASVLTISKGPVAKFTADQNEGCVPFDVSFHNASETGDAPLNTAFWDFRDGTVSASDNPEHRYNQSGNFDVFLKITDNNGCTDYTESKGLITVHPKPEIRFSASVTAACEPPLWVNFNNYSEADVNLNYHWDFGNGTTSDAYNATAQYNTAGSYDVTLRADNELDCASSLTKWSCIVIGNMSGQLFSIQGIDTIYTENAFLCPGKTIFGTTVNGSTDYTWYIQYKQQKFTRKGREFAYNLTDSGRIDVKLVYGRNSACPDSMEISFRVDHISADFEMDKEYSCQLPVSLNLTDKSENATVRKWILPDNSEDTVSNILDTITYTLSHEELYSHTVNEIRFPFIHIATSANGCRDTVIKDFRVSLPVARFMPDSISGCVPLDVTFYDSSRSAEPINKWTYIINNVPFSQSDVAPFVHTFQDPGEYKVLLAIENDFGCKDTSYPITIHTGNKLRPDFTVFPEQVCFGDIIRLEDKTILHDSIDFWHYSSPGLFNKTVFGNSVKTIKVLPASMGYKSIQLEVGYNGCISDTVIQQAFYVNPPAGSFHESFSCDSPLIYTFVSDAPMASSLEWKINDSVFYNMDSLRYQFPSSGDYSVTLTAVNSTTSCSAVTNMIVKARKVKARFMADPVVCFGDSVIFDADLSNDYINECYNEGFLWNFNDHTTRKRTFKNSYGHMFSDTGTFVTELIVRADDGCEDTFRRKILVIRPEATFTTNVDTGCASGLTVLFSNTSTDKFPVTWKWIFGDNTSDSSSASSIQHTYTSGTSRVFWAGLVIQNRYGCTNSSYIPISLYKPAANFQADDNFICAGDLVNFSAQYNEYDSFLWDFGDGTTSAVSHNHVYPTPGIYDVTLIVNKNGCQDSALRKQYISVEKADAAYSVNDSIFDCYPARVIFSHTAGSPVAERIWTFDQGIQSSGYRENYQYNYSRPGVYNTSLRIITPNNCRATRSKTISITGPYATFDFEPNIICYGDPVAFNLTSSQDVSEMRWIFGDGETSTDVSPVHNYKAKGVIHPALLVKNSTCEVTLTFATLSVSEVTADFDFPGDKTSFCLNDELHIINHSGGYQDITWTLYDTFSIEEPSLPPLILFYPGTMQIGLTVRDARGCADSLKKSITIMPLPVFAINGDSAICSGIASSLQIDPANSGWSVLWQPPEGLNNPASLSPSVTIDSTRDYIVAVTDSNGCKATKEITIRVKQPPDIIRLPLQDTAIFIGEKIELSVESDNQTATYSWSPDYHISCRSCNRPIVAPERDIIYTVTIKDECFSVTQQFPIEVIIDFYIEAPDAFSPNSDGNNDIFRLETRNIREIKEFKIFNRWGNLVFETTRLDEGWDGTTNGKAQNIDTYAYYIRAITEHGYETEKKGNFLLLK